jgi:uncharacterized protein (TIGR03435 family)
MFRLATLFCATALLAHGQKFIEASITPVRPNARGVQSVPSRGGPGISFRGSTLRSLLMVAYGVESYQISGPAWLAEEHFDVTAKAPPGPINREKMNAMLRGLLEEKFRIMTHRDQKELRGYVLATGQGTAILKPPQASRNRYIATGAGYIECGDCTLEHFSGMLTKQLNEPVVDATGITGEYDLAVHFRSVQKQRTGSTGLDMDPIPHSAYFKGIPDEGSVNAPPPLPAMLPPDRSTPGPSLPKAIRDQLGLELESKKVMVDMLVIDHIEKVPL